MKINRGENSLNGDPHADNEYTPSQTTKKNYAENFDGRRQLYNEEPPL